ncbi:hypothetical protein D9M73_65200 [compost metagenome]
MDTAAQDGTPCTAPLFNTLKAAEAERAVTPTNRHLPNAIRAALAPFAPPQSEIHHVVVNHKEIDKELVAKGLEPLNAEQIECLNDPLLADEAADMLDDLQARCGVSAAACEAALPSAATTLSDEECQEIDMAVHQWKVSGGPARDHQERAIALEQGHRPRRIS